MDDKEIVHERLEYTLEKNKGVYFDITPTTKKLNEKVFINKSLLNDIEINVEKFWENTLCSQLFITNSVTNLVAF